MRLLFLRLRQMSSARPTRAIAPIAEPIPIPALAPAVKLSVPAAEFVGEMIAGVRLVKLAGEDGMALLPTLLMDSMLDTSKVAVVDVIDGSFVIVLSTVTVPDIGSVAVVEVLILGVAVGVVAMVLPKPH